MISKTLTDWVEDVAQMTQPDRIVWCNGSEDEYHALIEQMLREGTLLRLNERKYPNCYLHRSHPTDVARTEHLTFICTPKPEDAGPTNNWMSPEEARERVGSLFRGCMRGRTMYVVPYLMGPPGSPFSEVGVEVTDSPYVVANMRIMTRMGTIALEHLGDSDRFVRGLHSLGDLSPERRYICHFPEERMIWSIGSGYGGNALLGKKCHSLRIASVEARDEGWLAEHMLIIGVEDPEESFAVLSDGTRIEAPKPLEKALRLLKRRSKQLSRKQKRTVVEQDPETGKERKRTVFSRNYEKAALCLARLHRRARNIRRDFLHKVATELAKAKPVLVVEDLNVRGLARNGSLSRAIQDVGWGAFRRMLEYKCAWYGSHLVVAPRDFPSTRMCSRCGWVGPALPLSQRVFRCGACGLEVDRDLNAALNLRNYGLAALKGPTGSSPGSDACGDPSGGGTAPPGAGLRAMGR